METLTGYRISVRYDLAKKKLDENFLRWLSIPTTTHLIQKLIDECKSPNFSLTHPPPTFQTRLSTPASPTINSPKRSSLTPPLSPSAHEKFVSTHAVSLPPEVLNSSPSKTQPMPALIASIKPIIPQFYFPKGRPADREIEEKNNQLINEVFRSDMMTPDEFHLITTTVCGLPKTLTSKLFDLIGGSHSISKPQFVRFWKSELENKSVAQRFFTVLKKPDQDYIEREDLKPIMKIIMETHPGLEFLKATPEFQERYADTVIERIFFTVDLNDDGKITIRELKKSNLVQVFLILDEEEDINKIRDYFSYEHFYVLYCRFWELDNDHDFIIDKEDFARYEGHSLSRKAIDRIFEGHARKFKCPVAGKMSYDDFTWFMLCEEDKTTVRSLEYWFRVIDLDNNGIITGHEMEYFYEEQLHRLEYLNQEAVQLKDVVCQMVDLLKPKLENQFTLEDFKRHRSVSGVFFNCLLNLNKFIAYEQRDPFTMKHEQTENPDFSDWDRFAIAEYVRLAMEEENAENVISMQSEVLDEAWDSDHEDN